MSKPIIVGYDPQTFDRAPVNSAVGAARFTGAPLVIASVCVGSAVRDGSAAGRLDDLAADASGALDARRPRHSTRKASPRVQADRQHERRPRAARGGSRRLAADARCPVIVLPRGVEASLEALMAETPGI